MLPSLKRLKSDSFHPDTDINIDHECDDGGDQTYDDDSLRFQIVDHGQNGHSLLDICEQPLKDYYTNDFSVKQLENMSCQYEELKLEKWQHFIPNVRTVCAMLQKSNYSNVSSHCFDSSCLIYKSFIKSKIDDGFSDVQLPCGQFYRFLSYVHFETHKQSCNSCVSWSLRSVVESNCVKLRIQFTKYRHLTIQQDSLQRMIVQSTSCVERMCSLMQLSSSQFAHLVRYRDYYSNKHEGFRLLLTQHETTLSCSNLHAIHNMKLVKTSNFLLTFLKYVRRLTSHDVDIRDVDTTLQFAHGYHHRFQFEITDIPSGFGKICIDVCQPNHVAIRFNCWKKLYFNFCRILQLHAERQLVVNVFHFFRFRGFDAAVTQLIQDYIIVDVVECAILFCEQVCTLYHSANRYVKPALYNMPCRHAQDLFQNTFQSLMKLHMRHFIENQMFHAFQQY